MTPKNQKHGESFNAEDLNSQDQFEYPILKESIKIDQGALNVPKMQDNKVGAKQAQSNQRLQDDLKDLERKKRELEN